MKHLFQIRLENMSNHCPVFPQQNWKAKTFLKVPPLRGLIPRAVHTFIQYIVALCTIRLFSLHPTYIHTNFHTCVQTECTLDKISNAWDTHTYIYTQAYVIRGTPWLGSDAYWTKELFTHSLFHFPSLSLSLSLCVHHGYTHFYGHILFFTHAVL